MPLESSALHRAVFAGLIVASLASCTLRQPLNDEGALVNKGATSAQMLTEHLQIMQRLVQGTASDKAEIVANAKRDYESAPTASHELRLALVLATPGHPGTDPARAQGLLRELMANPMALVPGERSLAFVQLQQIDDYLTLQAENHRLAGDAARTEQRLAAATHRLSVIETEETPRLRKELQEARTKLEQITNIEKSTNDRRARVPATTPPPPQP